MTKNSSLIKPKVKNRNKNKQTRETANEEEIFQNKKKESQISFDIDNLVVTNQQEINNGLFPSYEPPPGWKKIGNDFSTFDFKNVHKEENELWLFKIPSTVSKSDLRGLTLKLPTRLSRVPTKVATIQKARKKTEKAEPELTEYHVYEMPNDEDISQENEIAKEFIQESRAPHEMIFRKMKELEIFLPCEEAQGLLLSHKIPTRYFNICRSVNLPDQSSNIDSILAKKPVPIPHPPETFIPRYTASFPDFSEKHMIEARTAKRKFRNRMVNEWNFPKWQQQMKKHEEITERTYKEYQKKCETVVNKSKKKLAKDVECQKAAEGEEEKIKKRKRKSLGDYNISILSSDSESEKSQFKKIKILADIKRQSKFKCEEKSDTDPEILEEVAEEEAAFIKLAKNQIYQRKQDAKETQKSEKMIIDTWTPALVNYPIYKPSETWWSKTYDKILNETEQTKLKPKLIKKRYTLEERLEYYKKHRCEPPLYAVPKTRGKKIEINYGGIEEDLEIPEPRRKEPLSPPPPGTTGHLRPLCR